MLHRAFLSSLPALCPSFLPDFTFSLALAAPSRLCRASTLTRTDACVRATLSRRVRQPAAESADVFARTPSTIDEGERGRGEDGGLRARTRTHARTSALAG